MAEDERLKREKKNRVTRQKRHEQKARWQGMNGGARRVRKEATEDDLRTNNPQTDEEFE